MNRSGRLRLAAALLLASMATTGCTSAHPTAAPGTSAPVVGAPSGSPSGARVADADWPTNHHDAARTGVAPGFPPAGKLSLAWRVDLDGAVYGQPLVVGDRVFAATENDTVVALDAASGRQLWTAHLGLPIRRSSLPCGNIDPLGITGSMVYDPATGLLFALAEFSDASHALFGIDAATGAVRTRRAADPPKGDRRAHQQRSALTLLDGRVYVAFGGLAGDCAKYIGTVLSLPTTGDGPAANYTIPTTREGGIWAPGGGIVHNGHLLYAVGNGESTAGYDGSDSVIALNPDLTLADRYTPSVWADDNANDLDLGSMTPAVVGGHVLIAGKRGEGYVLDPAHLGGIGGEVSKADLCKAFGTAAVDGDTAYVPCTDGPRAVTVDSGGHLRVRWHAKVAAQGSPVVGGGVVWAVDYGGGMLYTLDPASGAVRERLDIGQCPHFASPALARGKAYVGTLSGVVAVSAG